VPAQTGALEGARTDFGCNCSVGRLNVVCGSPSHQIGACIVAPSIGPVLLQELAFAFVLNSLFSGSPPTAPRQPLPPKRLAKATASSGPGEAEQHEVAVIAVQGVRERCCDGTAAASSGPSPSGGGAGPTVNGRLQTTVASIPRRPAGLARQARVASRCIIASLISGRQPCLSLLTGPLTRALNRIILDNGAVTFEDIS
jgi:hypothetical protein